MSAGRPSDSNMNYWFLAAFALTASPSVGPSMRARRLRDSAKTSSSARMMACSCSTDSASGGGALIAGTG